MSLSNVEQSRQDQTPKKTPTQKVKGRFGRLPHGMVRQYYETGMPAKHALIMAIGDYLYKNSWTTIPLSDKDLANYIGCSKDAIKQARNFYTKNRHLLEVVQHRGKDGELTRKYQYTMLTDGQVISPDFTGSTSDASVSAPDSHVSDADVAVSDAYDQSARKPVTESISPTPSIHSSKLSSTHSSKSVVELINLEWKNSRGEPAQIGMIDQLVKSIQGKSAGISETEIVQLCQTVFQRDGEGETPAWFYKNKGAYLVDDLLSDRQEKLKEQQKKEDTKQRRQQHQELKSEAAATPANVDAIINRAGKGPEAKPRPGKRPKRPTSQLRKDQRVSQLENRNRVNENEFQTSLTENDAQAVTASVNQTMAALGLQRESDQQW